MAIVTVHMKKYSAQLRDDEDFNMIPSVGNTRVNRRFKSTPLISGFSTNNIKSKEGELVKLASKEAFRLKKKRNKKNSKSGNLDDSHSKKTPLAEDVVHINLATYINPNIIALAKICNLKTDKTSLRYVSERSEVDNYLEESKKHNKEQSAEKLETDSGIFVLNTQSDNSCSEEELLGSNLLLLAMEDSKGRTNNSTIDNISSNKSHTSGTITSQNLTTSDKIQSAAKGKKPQQNEVKKHFSTDTTNVICLESDLKVKASTKMDNQSLKKNTSAEEDDSRPDSQKGSQSPLNKFSAAIRSKSKLVKTKSQDRLVSPTKKKFFSRLSSTSNLLDKDTKRKTLEGIGDTKINCKSIAESFNQIGKERILQNADEIKDSKLTGNRKQKKIPSTPKRELNARADLIEKSEAYKLRMEKIQASRLTKDSKQASKTSITSVLFETSNNYQKEILDQLNSELWGSKSREGTNSHKNQNRDKSVQTKQWSRMNTSPSLNIAASSSEGNTSSVTYIKRKPVRSINFTKETLSSTEAFEQFVHQATRSSIYDVDNSEIGVLCQKVTDKIFSSSDNRIDEEKVSINKYQRPKGVERIHKFELNMPKEIKNRQFSSRSAFETTKEELNANSNEIKDQSREISIMKQQMLQSFKTKGSNSQEVYNSISSSTRQSTKSEVSYSSDKIQEKGNQKNHLLPPGWQSGCGPAGAMGCTLNSILDCSDDDSSSNYHTPAGSPPGQQDQESAHQGER